LSRERAMVTERGKEVADTATVPVPAGA